MGILLNIPQILNLNPKRVQRILDLKKEEQIQEFNQRMGFAWEVGKLVGLAVNSPKDYPRSPTTYKERIPQVESKEDYLRKWAVFVEQNRVD